MITGGPLRQNNETIPTVPDKRRVGLVLCAASAALMLAFGMVVADNLFSAGTTDVAKEAQLFDGFSPAGMSD